jgi:TPR repeat protein
MMQSIVRRVAVGLAAAVRDKVAKEAEELCASGQCAAAVVPLQRAIYLGDLPSRARMAHMLLDGREGVAKDVNSAFKLANKGARFGCHHCQGVLAFCYWGIGPPDGGCNYSPCFRDGPRSLELARQSSGKGSRYGQFVLGRLYHYGIIGVVAQDHVQAVALYRLAAAQNLDKAQWILGDVYEIGSASGGVAQDCAEALRLYKLAAAQGHRAALDSVAQCYEFGRGVRKNKAEAIRWYWRANSAGHPRALHALRKLLA